MRPIRTEPDDRKTTTSAEDDCVLVDELAHEFSSRLRDGERVTVSEYVDRYPQLADEIQELFPAIVTMEQLTRSKKNTAVSKRGLTVRQLGDFRVIGEIARGGMGIVYEAEQISLRRRVAMKVLPSQSLRSKNELLRFQREARTAARLHHTNIVPVFGVGEQDGYHYIVMQYIEGVGLDEVLNELRLIVLDQSNDPKPETSSARSNFAKKNAEALLTNRFSVPLEERKNGVSHSETVADLTPSEPTETISGVEQNDSPIKTEPDSETKGNRRKYDPLEPGYWRSVADIGVQAAEALAYAHTNNTLHRDVKPGNLLLDVHGVVWIADFGLAKAVEAENVTWTGDIVGTLSYMAPERFQDETDARSDVYGLGLTLYELLTLKRAFDGSERASLIHRVANDPILPPRKLNADIPLDLETIVIKATAKDPNDRYQTASDMAEDLRCFLQDRPISARRAGPVERAARWCRRNKTVAVLTASVASLLVLSSTLATGGYLRETQLRQKAEDTSKLAIDVLDRIYDQFAPSEMEIPSDIDRLDESGILVQSPEIPLSTEVAIALENLLVFYDQLSSQTENSKDVLAKSLTASRRVGDIHFRLGEWENALAAYQRAADNANKIDQLLDTSVSQIMIEHARVLNGLGQVQRKLRQWKDATESHAKAVSIVDGLDHPDAKFELARGLSLQRPRSPQLRATQVTRAISTLEDLVNSAEGKPQYSLFLARCLSCRFVPGKKCKTRARAQEILERLVADYPASPEYRYELGRIYSKNIGCCPESEQMLRKADEVTQLLDVSYPDISSYAKLKSEIYDSLAKSLRAQGRLEEADQYYSHAIEKAQFLIKRESGNHWHSNRLANFHVRRSEVLLELDDQDGARKSLELAIGILEPLASDIANPLLERSTESLNDARRRISCLEF